MRPIRKLINAIRDKPLLGEFLVFGFSTVVLQASRFGINFYCAGLLGPETWGVWYILNLAIAYSGLLHLGIINAMNREVPIFRGRDDPDTIRLMQSVTLGVVLVAAAVAGIGLLVGSLMFADEILRGPLTSLALLLMISLFNIYLQTHLKSLGRFHRMGCQQLLMAGLLPLAVLPLVSRNGLAGYILGLAIATGLVAAAMISFWKFNLKPVFNRGETVRLMRIGLPILFTGFSYILLTTADRLVIVSLLDSRQLGYYSLSIMVLGMLGLIPQVVAQQIYPRMGVTWGASGSVPEVFRWVFRQIRMAAGITLPISVVLFLLVPPLVRYFLPDFIPGIPAIRIIVIGPIFLSLAGGFGNLLITLNRQVYYLGVALFALLLNVTLNVLLVKAGHGITGVAIGTTITYAVYSIILVSVGLTFVRRDRTLQSS